MINTLKEVSPGRNTLREVSTDKHREPAGGYKANLGVNKDFPREVALELGFEEEIEVRLRT